MWALITDSQFNAIALIAVAAIGIVPATLGAIWARNAKSNSADALHEVQTPEGKPDISHQVEANTELLRSVHKELHEHIQHSKLMDQLLAEVYLFVRPGLKHHPKHKDK